MPSRKTGLTMDADLLDETKSYGINVSATAKAGVERVVKEETTRRLQEELRPTSEAYNDYVRQGGPPPAKVRAFMPED
ncbi:MAG: type II toxin-antitoxin system CcdA family antitoxin [Pseudomonadota bacterium]